MASIEEWRALVETAGTTIDQLAYRTPDGIAVQPLYVSGPVASAATRGLSASRIGVCMRVDPVDVRRPGALLEDVDGGADALWIEGGDMEAYQLAARRELHVVWELERAEHRDDSTFERDRADEGEKPRTEWFGFDPIARAIRGVDAAHIARESPIVRASAIGVLGRATTRALRVSGVPCHEVGAETADELAIMLSTAVAYLRGLTDDGIDKERAANTLWFQIAIGRDTFGELCKLRALRTLVSKIFAAASITAAMPPIHAVCSPRTQTQRDPWVNMLRVSTEVFAAALGGADLVTPLPFDAALGEPSAHARRVARNTALVLREESHLGRVIDAAGGSYYLETRTDQLARAAWSRFQDLEREGGVVAQLASGALIGRLQSSWNVRASAIARRKEPVLGVSEFANLGEHLPHPVPVAAVRTHRDAEAFEALRTTLEGKKLEILLVQLGTPAESRARVGFARALLATVGVVANEASVGDALGAVPDVACLCGSDENYAAHAVSIAAELRESGAMKIALAGRPGDLEAALREAGVDAFIHVGCDVIAAVGTLLGAQL